MKAILVIDIDESMISDEYETDIYIAKKSAKGEYRRYVAEYSSIPLKPMPTKYAVNDITVETDRDISVCVHGVSLGYNKCLEEIEK